MKRQLRFRRLPAMQPHFKRIEFIGTRRIESGTLRMQISCTPGHPYNAERVKHDVQALLDTGFFDEVRSKVIDNPDDPNGKIVMFYLNERPMIRRIEYRGMRSITLQDLLQAYKERKIGLSVETYFDQAQLTRASGVIKELPTAHGHSSATVGPTTREP